MSKDQCHEFTCACLGTLSKRYDEKINSLYLKHDEDSDGYLTIDNFIAFYEDAARDHKASTVWSNLKSFGVNSEFKFPHELNQPVDYSILPRNRLAQDQKFYDTLFDFLHEPILAPLAFGLLQRLPVSKRIYEEILGVGQDTIDIQRIFEFQDHYTYFYKLNIISYLTESQLEVERAWLKAFVQVKGVQALYNKLKDILLKYSPNTQFQRIQIETINSSLKLIYQYFLRCFSNTRSLEALSLLQSDIDIDDKIQFLFTGSFPKSEQSLLKIEVKERVQWLGDNPVEMTEVFVNFLEKMWVGWGEGLQKDYSKLWAFSKTVSISCLLLGSAPSLFISKFKVFLEKAPSQRLLRQLYTLILCLCFYSDSNQQLYITELFKHITLSNITAQYFKILAVLVSKFGLQQERVSEMPEVLLKNILTQRNELTIEGCAKLLANFHLGQHVGVEEVELLWDKCLFGKDTSCKKEQTRSAIYDLIHKVCSGSKEVTNKVIQRTLSTISNKIRSIKVTYSTEVNQRAVTGYAGIKNLGNICYMNSILQQLYMNQTFRYLLLRIDDGKAAQWVNDSKDKPVDDNFLHQTQRIFGYLERTSRVDFIPSAFCVAYKPFGQSVNIMMQQDVQEFVSMFFDRLEVGIKDHPLGHLVDNFYTGKYTNLFSCHECKQTKKVQENFYSLSLEVKNSKTLAQSFGRFSLGQLINDYNCDFCNRKVDVSKKTRISNAPQILIVHLQRIVFNLDTFINQKITNKHQFPLNFNIYPYSLDYYEKQQANEPNLPKQHPNYQYELTGIICHIGNAEMGHYISYIRGQNGKWFDFNDTLVTSFNPQNIQVECFGGSFTYEDEYDWEKRENSKSAYLLIYQKTKPPIIEMVVKSKDQKITLLKELDLEQIIQQEEPAKIESQPTQSQEESSSMVEDSEKERQDLIKSEMEQIEMIRKHKSEDNIEVESILQREHQLIVVRLKDTVRPYIPPSLNEQIEADNEIHFFQKCLASASFSRFFAKLLILPHTNSQEMVKLCQRLTFGFWLKSPSFKQLLYSLSQYIKSCPAGLGQIITENTNLTNLLIENSEIDIRTNIANFLADSFSYYIAEKQLTLDQQDNREENLLVLRFLDNLFELIPTTVSKCWTKFNQYFLFWYQFARKQPVEASYMVRKQHLKHFIDYFLDKKSPLKIYIGRPTIGSTYASPNFTMLLKTIQVLLEFYIRQKITLGKDERKILINFDFIEKLIHDNYESIASKIVQLICPHSLYASEKIAVVLVKGLSKSNYETVQPYLDVLHEFILINDEYQILRILWVLGKQTLVVSTISKTLSAMNGYSLEDRIYEFGSGLQIQSGTTLLQPIYTQNKRTQNLCIMCLQELLKLCNTSAVVRKYVYSLGAPSYIHGRYVDFFEEFINRYIDDARRIYGYSSSTGFNKEELGKNVKRLHEEVTAKVREEGGQIKVGTQEQSANKNEKKICNEDQSGEQMVEVIIQQLEYHENSTEKKSSVLENSSMQAEQEKANQDPGSNHLLRTQSEDHTKETENYLTNLFKVNSNDSENEIYTYKRGEISDTEYVDNPIPDTNEEIKITVDKSPIKSVSEEDKQNRYYSQEEENLLQSPKKEKPNQSEEDKSKYIYHPVKFIYKMVQQIESGMDNVRIQQHASQLIQVRTYPTGLTNKAFTSTYSHKKVSERLLETAWQNQRKSILKGYFVTNNNKSGIRIQTDDGSCMIRSLDTGWVWATQILRIWTPDRFVEWPEWSLYSQEGREQEAALDLDDQLE